MDVRHKDMFDNRNIQCFKGAHDPCIKKRCKPALICGLGPSLKLIKPKHLMKTIIFGVNDIEDVIPVNYLTITENLFENKNPEYQEKHCHIRNSHAEIIFSVYDNDYKNSYPVYLPLQPIVTLKNEFSEIEDIYKNNKIPVFGKSLTANIGLAMYMGFRVIYIIGFDLCGERIIRHEDNLHVTPWYIKNMIYSMQLMQSYAKDNCIEIYNLSDTFIIKAFSSMQFEIFERNIK